MMKTRSRIVSAVFTLLLFVFSLAIADSGITHHKHSNAPATTDPTKIGGPDWNAPLDVDVPTLSSTLHVFIASGNPNGILTGAIGDLARDTTGQLWINTTGSTVWVPFVRADGGTAQAPTAFASLGDSNTLNMGTTTDNAVVWNQVVTGSSRVPKLTAVLNSIYGTASSEPIPLVDHGTTDLQVENVSSFPGYGYEMSFGQKMFDLFNGVGTAPTTTNKIWILKFGISGVELKQMLPASTYGQATPAFNGLNAYNYWKTRTQTLLATAGRKLGGVVVTLGGNDGSNGTDAAAVAANMVTLATQIRSDFGQQVAIVWVKLHVSANTPNTATVRTQMITGAAAIPNCRLIVIDSYPINGDLLHFSADPVWDMGLQAAEAMRQLTGLMPRVVSQPTIVGFGTPDYNKAAGALAPRGFPLSRHGDLELLFVGAMKNSGVATVIPTPSGWTSLGNSSQAIAGQTQEFALFARNLLQSDLDANNGLPPAVSITTGNDENYAVRITVRGPNLFPSVDGSVVSYAATSFTTSGVNAGGTTTTAGNDLVVTFVGGQGGGASLTENFTAVNATTNTIVLIQAPLIQNTSNFGLLAVVFGVKVVAGTTGTTVITPNLNTNPSGFTVAIKA